MKKVFFASIYFYLIVSRIFLTCAEANILLRVVAVNPSATQKQKVVIETSLPKEVGLEDVIDAAELGVSYDSQQGNYFIHGEFELDPGEVFERNIEIKDVWQISNEQLVSLQGETQQMRELLKDSDFKERSDFLLNSIEKKLKHIIFVQANPATNPEKHISDYRDSLIRMSEIHSEMLLARSFLTQLNPISKVDIWRMILGIVIFMGLIGISFYFLWQKKLKVAVNEESVFYVPEEDKKDEKDQEENTKEQ